MKKKVIMQLYVKLEEELTQLKAEVAELKEAAYTGATDTPYANCVHYLGPLCPRDCNNCDRLQLPKED